MSPNIKVWHSVSKRAGVGWKWKWPICVGKSQMSIFWCISITNNVKSCKTNQWKGLNGQLQWLYKVTSGALCWRLLFTTKTQKTKTPVTQTIAGCCRMKGHCPGLSKNVKHMGGGDDLIQSRQSFANTVGQCPALLYSDTVLSLVPCWSMFWSWFYPWRRGYLSQQRHLPSGPQPMPGSWMKSSVLCRKQKLCVKAEERREEGGVCRKNLVLSDAPGFQKAGRH